MEVYGASSSGTLTFIEQNHALFWNRRAYGTCACSVCVARRAPGAEGWGPPGVLVCWVICCKIQCERNKGTGELSLNGLAWCA